MQFKDFPPEWFEDVYQKVREGCPRTLLCDLMGIPRSSLYDWLKKGEQPDSAEYGKFKKEFLKAEGEFRMSCIRDIKMADPRQWQAKAWLLERRDPESFSERFRLKKYPEHLIGKPYKEQADEIYKLLVRGKISLAEASAFVDILSTMAKVDDVSELRKQLFEIEEKQNG